MNQILKRQTSRSHYGSKDRQHNGEKKKDKQRSTKHTHKTKDRLTRTALKPGGELICSRGVSSSWFTSGTRRVILVTNSMIIHDWEKDREVLTTNETYSWLFVTQIFHSGQMVSISEEKLKGKQKPESKKDRKQIMMSYKSF